MQTEERITKLFKYLKERKRIKLNSIDTHVDMVSGFDDKTITAVVDLLEWVLGSPKDNYYDTSDWE